MSSFNRAYGANLIDVYYQALNNDPVYQEVIYNQLANKEGVAISLGALLPQISAIFNPSVTRSGYTGSQLSGGLTSLDPRNNTARQYVFTLSASQTVFDFAKFAKLSGERSISKQADATLNAALQDLMVRVTQAYFNVARDEYILSYTEESKDAFLKQLHQVKKQHDVGFKTATDISTAQAAYNSAVSAYINAKISLEYSKENLHAITGKYYPTVAKFKKNMNLINPSPLKLSVWEEKSMQQNWSVKASQYALFSARESIKQSFAGHLPTIEMQASYNKLYANNINGYVDLNERNGTSTTMDKSISVNVTVPLLLGGTVVAQTRQSTYLYESAQKRLEQTQRRVTNSLRQSYFGVVEGANQLRSDRSTIYYYQKTVQDMEKSYRIGSVSLYDIVIQRQQFIQSQIQYATHAATYINNLFLLKQAAGVLNFEDLSVVNNTLVE